MENFFQRSLRVISVSTSQRTSTLLVILIIIAAIPLTVFVAQQRQNLSSRASVTCQDNPESPPSGYKWKADCGRQCSSNGDCPQNNFDGWNVNPSTSNWCYGFEGPQHSTADWRCLMLVKPPCEQAGGSGCSGGGTCTLDHQSPTLTADCATCIDQQAPGVIPALKNMEAKFSGCSTVQNLNYWCNDGISAEATTQCNAIKNGACASSCGGGSTPGDNCVNCIVQKGPDLLGFYQRAGWETDPSWWTRIVNDWCSNLNPTHCESIKNNECALSCGRAVPTPVPPTPVPPTPVPPTPVPPTPVPGDTLLSFTITLGGIGSGGNPNPVHTQKQFTVQLFNSSNSQVGSDRTGTLNFDSSSGTFRGNINLGGGIATGDHSIKVKADKYLRRRIPLIVHIVSGTTNQIPPATLIVGDINNDNKLDPLDYNIFVSCYGASATTSSCEASDLDDNSRVDGPDFNLFIRSLSVQEGD